MTKNLRCMLHLHHYVRRYAHDADQLGSHEYMECLRCGHFRDVKAVPPFFTRT